MSTHTHSADVRTESHAAHDHGHGHPHHAHPPAVMIPMWLKAAFGIVILIGVLSLAFGKHFAENGYMESMAKAEAYVNDKLRENGDGDSPYTVRPNGLVDGYAIIKIKNRRDDIAEIVALCDETDPAMGLRLFRAALDEKHSYKDPKQVKSAKLVALYCANYLAHAQQSPSPKRLKGVLEATDAQKIVDMLDPRNETDFEVRKYALHALSDLVILTDPVAIEAVKADDKADTKYTKISDEMKSAATAALDADVSSADNPPPGSNERDRRKELKITTKLDTVNGARALMIRWSTPGLARAWWKEFSKQNGKWDMEQQRFVFP